jgi:Uma2 family endonuclease
MVSPWYDRIEMELWSPSLASDREHTPGRVLTLDEWIALDEDESGELVDGRLEEEEMPGPVHELAVTWLITRISTWLGGDGFVFGSEIKLVLGANRGRKPDLSVYLHGRGPLPRHGGLREPPSFVVEVVTPTPRDERRDRVEKMTDYAAFGVACYWLVDPALGSFEVFELVDGRYAKALGATSGRVDVPGCAGLELDLDGLWRELARLGPDAGE